ncbi:MAG: cytochrome c [Actinomycetota bacterium]|nr:cytochrome c [Actinomycetota bacterium]
MSHRRRLLTLPVITVTALAAAGCGEDDAPLDPASVRAGQQVFAASGCATCHTLAAAGAGGTIGPNLDRVRPARDGVARQVRDGGSGMPSFTQRLTDAQIDALAAYVAAVAGE